MKTKQGRKGRKENHRKRLIQIRTNSRGWTTVEFIGIKNGRLVVRLSDGQIVHRHLNQVRYGVARKIPHKNPVKRKSDKKYKTKKKRNKFRKPPRKNNKILKSKRKRKFDVLGFRVASTDN